MCNEEKNKEDYIEDNYHFNSVVNGIVFKRTKC